IFASSTPSPAFFHAAATAPRARAVSMTIRAAGGGWPRGAFGGGAEGGGGAGGGGRAPGGSAIACEGPAAVRWGAGPGTAMTPTSRENGKVRVKPTSENHDSARTSVDPTPREAGSVRSPRSTSYSCSHGAARAEPRGTTTRRRATTQRMRRAFHDACLNP